MPGKKKNITLQIIPDGIGKTWAIKLDYKLIQLLLILFLLMLVAFAIGLIKFSEINLKAFTAEDLAKKNQVLQRKQAIIDSLEREIDLIHQKTLRIENMVQTFVASESDSSSLRTLPQNRDLITRNILKEYASSVESLMVKKSEKSKEKSITSSAYKPSIWPVLGVVSREYSNQHPGMDIVASENTLILCTAPGIVMENKWDRDLGNYVVVSHGNLYKTLYGHLNSSMVKIGDHLDQGSAIGTLGNTGNSTGPHLHYEVMENNERMDPKNYLTF